MGKKRINKILLAIDNSDTSALAAAITSGLARSLGSEVVGIHAYNAFMHEGAFRIMEPTLPEMYQKEEILQKQRDVHSKLINVGMERISLSYLKPLEEIFAPAGVSFRPVVREGKNFRALNEIIKEEGGDLIIMGFSGFNSNSNGFIGSVCLRVLRSNDRDFLIVKRPLKHSNHKFVVCLDGSNTALNALRMAGLFAGLYGAELHLVYVFDSALHKELFGRLKESLINREGFSFNSRQQEKIHDEFIDKGLARVGRMVLDRAEASVFCQDSRDRSQLSGWGLAGEGPVIVKEVLEGHIYKRLCEYASDVEADLIFVGRTGRHFVEGMDIGAVAENVVRFSPCSVFVAKSEQYRGWEL